MFYTVYRVSNLINDKIYIGVHLVADLVRGDSYMGSGLGIKRALKKYGSENFKKEILAVFTDLESAYLMEAALVNEVFVLREDTYNMGLGGYGCGGHTEETKQKISEARMGVPLSEEHKQKLSTAKKGEKHFNYGKNLSEETRQKMSEARMGIEYTKETKKKMSDAHMGRVFSEEHKSRISKTLRGKLRGENHPRYGKKDSEETRRNKSDAAKEAWCKRRVNIYNEVISK